MLRAFTLAAASLALIPEERPDEGLVAGLVAAPLPAARAELDEPAGRPVLYEPPGRVAVPREALPFTEELEREALVLGRVGVWRVTLPLGREALLLGREGLWRE